MSKTKRKSLSDTVDSKTKPETIKAVLNEKGKRPSKDDLIGTDLSRVSTNISSKVDTEMRVFIAKKKATEKGYNIRKFLEEAIIEKIAKETLAKMD